jgi:hypothetical protein
MTGSSRYIRSEVGEIERRLRSLEKTIENLGNRTSSQARDTSVGLADAAASVLSDWAPRFREGANAISDRSAALGTDAARYGTAALDQLLTNSVFRLRTLVAEGHDLPDRLLRAVRNN